MLKKLVLICLSSGLLAWGSSAAATFTFEGSVQAQTSVASEDTTEFTFSGTAEIDPPAPGGFFFTLDAVFTSFGPYSVGTINPTIFDASNISALVLISDSNGDGLFQTRFDIGGDPGTLPANFNGNNDFRWSFENRTGGSAIEIPLSSQFTLPLDYRAIQDGGVFGAVDSSESPFVVGSVTFTEVAPVPLPAAAWFFLTALAGAGWFRRRQKRAETVA